MPTTAKVVADSISESGVRLTTMVLEYPRIIHSEFMTHRMFSRNASSSRAIPVEKQIERINNDPFIPSQFGKNKKGMSAEENLDSYSSEKSRLTWERVAQRNANSAAILADLGVHKQLANRLLEPFSHIQVAVTATEWDSFFAQRLHPAAQPEIQELARVMKEAMENSTPKLLKVTTAENFGWHLPFIEQKDIDGVLKNSIIIHKTIESMRQILIKVSVARCARVSYGLNERGWGDIEKDLALYDMLHTSGHWSPFEHQVTPMEYPKQNSYIDVHHVSQFTSDWEAGTTHMDSNGVFWSGNFKSWTQNRQLIQQTF